jgi:hypothetical protein
VAFPPLYLGGATAVQAILLAAASFVALRSPTAWRKPAAGVLLAAAGAWFARLLLA